MSFFFNSDTPPPDDSEPVSARVARVIATTRAPPPRAQTPPAPSFYKREIADLTSQLETALRVIDELKGVGGARRRSSSRVGSATTAAAAAAAAAAARVRIGSPLARNGGEKSGVPSSYLPRVISNLPHMLGSDPQQVVSKLAAPAPATHQKPRSSSPQRPSSASSQASPPPPPRQPPASVRTYALSNQIQSLTSALRICVDVIAEEGRACARWRRKAGMLEKRLQDSDSEEFCHHYHQQPYQYQHPPAPPALMSLLPGSRRGSPTRRRRRRNPVSTAQQSVRSQTAAAGKRGGKGDGGAASVPARDPTPRRPATVGNFPASTAAPASANARSAPDSSVQLVQQLFTDIRAIHGDQLSPPSHPHTASSDSNLVLPAARLRKALTSNRPRYESAWPDLDMKVSTAATAALTALVAAANTATTANTAAQPPVTSSAEPEGAADAQAEQLGGNVGTVPVTAGSKASAAFTKRATTAPALSKISIRIPTASAHRGRKQFVKPRGLKLGLAGEEGNIGQSQFVLANTTLGAEIPSSALPPLPTPYFHEADPAEDVDVSPVTQGDAPDAATSSSSVGTGQRLNLSGISASKSLLRGHDRKFAVKKFRKRVIKSTATAGLKSAKATASILNDFRRFVLRGNVVDLALGVIIGGAFTAIVTSVGSRNGIWVSRTSLWQNFRTDFLA
ncbi:hypothetical protein HDU89_005284 [Geranomyces variabilis]|nr:hypothetical protein HDU89_005284 [Geranomyces variabilis]